MAGSSDSHSSRRATAQSALIEEIRKSIRDERVLAAMARTPRELFVPEHLRELAYEDMPLSIGHGQTISQPLIVAMMLQALELMGDEKVLEVGTGSGYEAVLLGQLARRVVTVERIPELAERAAKLIKTLGCRNVRVEVGGEVLGCPELGPYEGIVVAAGAPRIPPSLVDQLTEGGRMVIPVGSRYEQDLKQVRKLSGGLEVKSLGLCRFVPLIGEGAWEE